jgi:hypothetical protein
MLPVGFTWRKEQRAHCKKKIFSTLYFLVVFFYFYEKFHHFLSRKQPSSPVHKTWLTALSLATCLFPWIQHTYGFPFTKSLSKVALTSLPLIFFYFYVHVYIVFYVYVCIVCIQASEEARSRHEIPWNWRCGWLWAAQCRCWELNPVLCTISKCSWPLSCLSFLVPRCIFVSANLMARCR